MKVGYLGPGHATFGFMAAEKLFAGEEGIEFIAYPNHTDVCSAVGKQEVEYGVVAVENVIDGIVGETIRSIDEKSRGNRILISGEVELPIELFFLRKPDDDSPPTKVVGHVVALGQCSKKVATFQKTHGDIPTETAPSNGKAAELASNDSSLVAVSLARAEQEYGLVRLEPNTITNNPNNFSRFWKIGTTNAKRSGNDKTCWLLNLDQPVPGGISKALRPFADRGINLRLIAPIPIRGRKWEYSFLIEFSGSIYDQAMIDAHEELCASGISMAAPIFLGSFPAGTTK